MKLGALEALRFPWWGQIDTAKRGDFKPLIKALRSDKPLPVKEIEERWLRDTLAAALAGELKRKQGRPVEEPMLASWWRWRLARRDPTFACAVLYVERYKDVQARRYNRRQGVEAEAIEKAARKYGVSAHRIFNCLHRAKRQR
jgi:hypothetical protein